MNISQAAKLSDLPVKTVRYYSDIGLIEPARRTEAGYRDYDEASIRKLIFIRRARAFGFSVNECRELLGLYKDSERSSAEVKKIAANRLVEIRKKQQDLQSLHDELSHLVDACNGDSRPDCPIIDYLS